MRRIAEQIVERVGKSLDLQNLAVLARARGADDPIARADQDGRVGIDRPRARLSACG